MWLLININIYNIVLMLMLILCKSNSNKLKTVINKSRTRLQSTTIDSIDYQQQLEINYDNFKFDILSNSKLSKARCGLLVTPHGNIETPNFVFCATKAAGKAITTKQLRDEGSQIILSNTYHLMLTPGSELIDKMGGLQKFTDWRGPMLTDSGGYQIFSMGYGSVSNEIKGKRNVNATNTYKPSLISINENEAIFRSYVDGSIINLSPEKAIKIQRQLGADLIVVLDECTPFNVDKEYTAESMRRSHRWAYRCLKEFINTHNGKQALYGIIQGGIYEDLRQESCDFVNNLPFFGMAIGGSLGATKRDMHKIVEYSRNLLRNDRPIHLLGIGGVRDIFHGVRCGIDTFDCVHPTRIARHAGALVKSSYWYETQNETPIPSNVLVKEEKHQLKILESRRSYDMACKIATSNGLPIPTIPARLNSKNLTPLQIYKKNKQNEVSPREHMVLTKSNMFNDPRPIDSTCNCYTCKNYSRSYLHHLFKAKEQLGGTLVTIHNVHFMNRLMGDIREGIKSDTLDEVEKYYVHPDLLLSLANETNELRGMSE